MKLHILNDLHVEYADFVIPQTDADVVVLAGDIGMGTGGLDWIVQQAIDKPVIYVPGNHEFYQHDLKLVSHLKKKAPSHVFVLDNDMVEVDGIRFLGSILWTDFALYGETDKVFSMLYARENMSDFILIRDGNGVLTPEDTIARHIDSRQWLQCMLEESFSGKTVVVTHHAPSIKSVHPRYEKNLLTPAFASDLESLMDGGRAALWIHGHTHDAFDYEIYDTRVVCNPRGYMPYESSNQFVPDCVIEI